MSTSHHQPWICLAILLTLVVSACTDDQSKLSHDDAMAKRVEPAKSPEALGSPAPTMANPLAEQLQTATAKVRRAAGLKARVERPEAVARTAADSYERNADMIAEKTELLDSREGRKLNRAPASEPNANANVRIDRLEIVGAAPIARIEPDDPRSLVRKAKIELELATTQDLLSNSNLAKTPQVYLQEALKDTERARTLLAQGGREQLSTEESKQTRLAALRIRAEALRQLAVLGEADTDLAESATDDYVAADADPAKKALAQHSLAQMYFSLKKLDKAKLACEKILAENPNDSTALSQLVAVLRNMADVQEKAGNHTEAVASRKSAEVYGARLRNQRAQIAQ